MKMYSVNIKEYSFQKTAIVGKKNLGATNTNLIF